jgi:benzoate-CoA ligase
VVATSGQDDDFDAFLAGQSEELASAEMDPEEPALWAYTSGTTGQPKGVVHVHASIPVGEKYVTEVLDIRPGDRMFATSKLFFGYALGQCLIGGLRVGATVILYDGWPDAAAAAQVIEPEQPNVVLSVPALYGAMLREGVAVREAFRRVRTYVSAGERLPEKLGRQWMDVTGGILLEAFGATETIYLFMSTTREAFHLGSCGRPMPWAEVRLTTSDGHEITRPDEPGHLWVRVPSLFLRYNKRPEATAEVRKEGWWRTGDIFSVDADGWWRPQGRSDEMLKVSGQWVSPNEVEEVALSVPGILEAAAVGIPNEDGLVRLALFAVPEVGASKPSLESRVVETLRSNLAVYKCPRNVRFVETIPRTATGKVQRFKLREMAMSI